MKQHCDTKYGWLALLVVFLLMFSVKLALGVLVIFIISYCFVWLDEDTKKRQEEYKKRGMM